MTNLKAGRDRVISYDILDRLLKHPMDTEAYKLGLIDEHGYILKDPETEEEEEALTTLDVLLLQIKELLGARMSKLRKYMFVRNHDNSVIEQIVLKAESRADKEYLDRVERSLRAEHSINSYIQEDVDYPSNVELSTKIVPDETNDDVSYFANLEVMYDSPEHKEATENIIQIVQNKTDDKLDEKTAQAIADEVRNYIERSDYYEDIDVGPGEGALEKYDVPPNPVDQGSEYSNWELIKELSWYTSEYLTFLRKQDASWKRIIDADNLLDSLFNVARKAQNDIDDKENKKVVFGDD